MRLLSCLSVTSILLLATLCPCYAIIDNSSVSPGNGGPDELDDVWQTIFNGWGLSKDGDEDSDGSSNLLESIAGTDPRNGGDSHRMSNMTVFGEAVIITFKAVAGKSYKVLSDTTPGGSYSTVENLISPAAGPAFVATSNNAAQTVSVAETPGVAKFYRVEVSDVDSDGDGLSDWAELQTGSNPQSADTDGNGISDYEELVPDVSVPGQVSIAASQSLASEDGPQSGTLLVSRSNGAGDCVVSYTLSGTATSGIDYSVSPGFAVNFAAGEKSKTILVNPAVDGALEGSESVTVTLTGISSSHPAAPVIGTQNQASAIIYDSTAATGTGLLGQYYDHASLTAAHAANFGSASTYAYTKTGNGAPNTGTIVIPCTYNGSPALQAGQLVRLSFAGGTLNTIVYNHLDYTVTAVSPGVSFTVSITGNSLPNSSGGDCFYSFQSIPHPPVVERVDATVDFDWIYGTPSAAAITVGSTRTDQPDNLSSYWEGYLAPGSAGSYRFQLDADDKARVLLDLNRNGTFELPSEQVVEHGWDTPGTVGTFIQSGAVTLAVPANAAQRYKIRVEHVETTGEARCRLQWLTPGSNSYGNIPTTNVFAHASSMTYNYTRTGTGSPNAGNVIVTLNNHGLAVNQTVNLSFATGNLFTPANGNFHGSYTVTAMTANTFTVAISAASLPASGTGTGYVLNTPAATTNGWYSMIYPNTTFSGVPGRIGVDGMGVTTSNNGLWGTGTPAAGLIDPETFSARWTGQVQPQFSEEYTFIVNADDGCALWINGQSQDLRTVAANNRGGGAYIYNASTGDVVVTYSDIVIDPNSFAVGETVRTDPQAGPLSHTNGSSYNYNEISGVMTVNYSNLTTVNPGGFQNGNVIEMDPADGPLAALNTLPYAISNVTATTFDVNIGAGLYNSGSGSINVFDTNDWVVTAVTANTFTYNVGAGKYLTGSGTINVEIANKVLKDWSAFQAERYVRIPMVGGVRYDIRLDYYENTGGANARLYWYSASQPKQIIPSSRLYPSSAAQAPVAHTSNTSAVAIVGGSFSQNVSGSNGASVTVSGLPSWATYQNGVITGTPPTGGGGDYQILITLTGANGVSTSVLNLHVEETDGVATKDYWTGVSGSGITSIPIGTSPTGSDTVTSLQGATDFGDNYGTRLRGYITAPQTGNYYFWLAAHGAAELWISNDSETVNLFKRASVTTGSATPQTWNAEAGQKSAWLALEEGKRYYFEVLYKAGAGTGDNVAVGWSKPGQSTSVPSEVVPGHVLDEYVPQATNAANGTLYVSTMLSQNGAITDGVGTSTLRLSEDETVAYVRFAYGNLTGELTDWHVHADAFLNHPSAIIFDGVEPPPGDGLQSDGSFKWTLAPAGTFSLAEIKELIKQGKAYINLHTALYPAGEIRGNYTVAAGSRTFTPPAAPPAWTNDNTTEAGAARFLNQATFGASISDITALKSMANYETWIDDQFTKPVGQHLPEVIRLEGASVQGGNFDESLSFNAWWWRSVTGEDQLRQRIAFALSEILVISATGPLDNNALALSYYYDQLLGNAFGNFRDILQTVTLTPSMGRYLDMLRNDKPDLNLGRIPNENYAREIKQLFSVGLFRMWPDGSLMLDSHEAPVDVYSQSEIIGFAHVFTGWDYGYDGSYRTALGAVGNWTRPMREVPARHFTGTKRLLNNEVLPGLATLGGQTLDPYATHTSTQYNKAEYQALPSQELTMAHDQLFNHPNVGPFICRQLIQRLVTSNPSRNYLYRVVQKFNDNGSGVRGDMKAVIKAILLDYEARSSDLLAERSFGKQREALLRVTGAARALRPAGWSGNYVQDGGRTITINTSAPHNLTSGNAYLGFTSGYPAPWSGTYAITVTNPTQFTIQAQGWTQGTYSIPANSTTCTVTMTNHWLQTGHKIFVDFASGGADGVAGLDGQVYQVSSASAESGTNGTFTFNIASGTSAVARTGNIVIPRFNPGRYTTASSGLAAPQDRRITMDTYLNHDLAVGDQVQLNFYAGSPQPVDVVVTVESVVDENTWTFLGPAAGTNLSPNQVSDSIYQFPLKSPPVFRSGSVGTRPGTFSMNNTDVDLAQTPLNSPTVFNYFLPDYKFAGSLASQGITTPEFQLTSETNVVRQANYLYNGIFGSSATNGTSSFNNGNNALVMDMTPWMSATASNDGLGDPANDTVPWTHNQNLPTLIDHFNVLLTSGQMPAGGKSVIKDFIATSISGIATGANCQVTTTGNHNLKTGDVVLVSGVGNGAFSSALNSNTTTRTITVTTPNSFTLNGVTCTSAPNSAGLTYAHVSLIAYNQGGTPTDVQKRDRLRSILHLFLTSPDYMIQR